MSFPMNANTLLKPILPDNNPERLAASYQYCEHVAKTQARNFYYSFVPLPPELRAAMCVIYAFMRYSDDVSDEAAEDSSKAEQMQEWRAALDRALAGEYGESLILPAFHDVVVRFSIPAHYFHELIDGTEMDLTKKRYETFEELYEYCYKVASVVGFVCIHVWGFDRSHANSLRYAESCGLAFQLTNILRDVSEDAARDRIYLPREDMERFGVTESDLKSATMSKSLKSLILFEAERAESYYSQAHQLLPLLEPAGRPTYKIMLQIYHGILETIFRQRGDVYRVRARLSTPRKLVIVASAWISSRLGR